MSVEERHDPASAYRNHLQLHRESKEKLTLVRPTFTLPPPYSICVGRNPFVFMNFSFCQISAFFPLLILENIFNIFLTSDPSPIPVLWGHLILGVRDKHEREYHIAIFFPM